MTRNPYFDVLKFFAILLVVFGHVYWAIGCKAGAPYFENFRCGMNMPLFFLISGYFAARTIENRDWLKLGRHLVGYFWPLAAVSCVFGVLVVLFSLEGSDNGIIGYAGRNFLFAAWFLWCLAICFTLTFLCYYSKSPILRGGGLLLLIIVLPCLNGVWYVDNVRAMLPYFLFGTVVLRRWAAWKDWRVGLLCLIVFVSCVFLQGDISSSGLNFYTEGTTWGAFCRNWRTIPLCFVRLVNGLCGSIGIMWLLSTIMSKFAWVASLAPLGRTTLWVYVVHNWLLMRVIDVGWYSHSVVCAIIWSLVLFGVSHAVGLICMCGETWFKTRIGDLNVV